MAPTAAGTTTKERIHNDLAGVGVDTAVDLLAIAQAQIFGDDIWRSSGVDLLDRHGVQFRFTKKNGVAVSDAFVNIGTGIAITAPDLPAGEFHEYEFRTLPPGGNSEAVTQFKLAWHKTRFQSIGNPHAVEPGIHNGVGTGRVTAIFDRSIAIAVSGIGTFEWPDFSWYYLGVPYSVLDHDETIDANDGSTVALASGESYLYLAVLDDGATTILKGDLVTGTAVYPADAPAVPAGNRLLGHGVRDFVADLTFTTLDELPDFFNVTTSGLDFTVARSGGPMAVDGSLVDSTTPVTGSLTASSTNTLSVLADGSVGVTLDGSLAQPGAQIIFDIVTDGSGETSRVDRRQFVRRRETVLKFVASAASNTTVTRTIANVGGRSIFIRPNGIVMQTSGLPTNSLVADIFTRSDLGGKVTIFTSFGSDDRRPTITSGSGSLFASGLAEVLEIPPKTEVAVDFIFGAGSNSDVVLAILADTG